MIYKYNIEYYIIKCIKNHEMFFPDIIRSLFHCNLTLNRVLIIKKEIDWMLHFFIENLSIGYKEYINLIIFKMKKFLFSLFITRWNFYLKRFIIPNFYFASYASESPGSLLIDPAELFILRKFQWKSNCVIPISDGPRPIRSSVLISDICNIIFSVAYRNMFSR